MTLNGPQPTFKDHANIQRWTYVPLTVQYKHILGLQCVTIKLLYTRSTRPCNCEWPWTTSSDLVTMRRKSRDSPMRQANVTGKLSIDGGKVLQRWRSSGGNGRLSHLHCVPKTSCVRWQFDLELSVCNNFWHTYYWEYRCMKDAEWISWQWLESWKHRQSA